MRSYTIEIEDPDLTPTELIARLLAEPNALNAQAVAGFVVDDRPARDLRRRRRQFGVWWTMTSVITEFDRSVGWPNALRSPAPCRD